MYSAPHLAIKYLRYYLSASNGKGHGTHSPFIFQFITKVLNDKTQYEAYDKIEKLRQELLKNDTVLTIEDFGAGSGISKTNKRTIASIAKNAAKPKKFGQLLFRMAKFYKTQYAIELGTSLGITTSYLAEAINETGNITTAEGSKEIADAANKNFIKLGSKNIHLVNAPFDDYLLKLVKAYPRTDLLFIDGNHRKEPTINYFNAFLPVMGNDGIMIFDDIHWSREMEEAWDSIKNHPAVRCTIDLFFIGIVFFRQEFKGKEHFTIRY